MNKTPKLRFKEFSRDWESKKISEAYSDLKAGSTPSKVNPRYFEGNIPWITSGELKTKYIYKTKEYITEEAVKSANLKIYEEGTFFIAITGLEAPGTRGSCGINKVKATTNQSCLAFQKSKIIKNEFLYYWYLLNGEHIGIKYTQGTKQQSLNNELVGKLRINIPSIKEQEKIASFFSLIDKKISLQSEKVEMLRDYKKGMMQKIFSRELRFKGFNEEWSTCKAKDLFESISDKNHNGDLEVLSVTQDKGVIPRSQLNIDIKFEKDNLVSYKKVKKSDFIISLRSFQGGIEQSKYIGLVSPAYTVFNFKKDINFNHDFFSIIFKSKNFINRLNSLTYGIRDGKAISFKDFSDVKLEFPSIEEQNKIASFFESIDEKISKEQEKLDSLNEYKKGLLQQMFV